MWKKAATIFRDTENRFVSKILLCNPLGSTRRQREQLFVVTWEKDNMETWNLWWWETVSVHKNARNVDAKDAKWSASLPRGNATTTPLSIRYCLGAAAGAGETSQDHTWNNMKHREATWNPTKWNILNKHEKCLKQHDTTWCHMKPHDATWAAAFISVEFNDPISLRLPYLVPNQILFFFENDYFLYFFLPRLMSWKKRAMTWAHIFSHHVFHFFNVLL